VNTTASVAVDGGDARDYADTHTESIQGHYIRLSLRLATKFDIYNCSKLNRMLILGVYIRQVRCKIYRFLV
jgi:hypothetical protein